jgi:UDP-GlcNAc:undecaprenyl-phosphate GlcNAc-1-phosphate transferase
MVAPPSADRWHRAPIPLLGGVAIVASTLALIAFHLPGNRNLLVLAITSLAIGGLGLIDDAVTLKPQVKLIGQVVLASILLHFGFTLELTPYSILNMFVTLLWIVGITNAFNLLDNMDGLAAGIAVIAVAFRALFFLWSGDLLNAMAAIIFGAAVLGFLARNFPPAAIFMGDAGSLFVGFFLAGLSLSGGVPYSRGFIAVIALPVLLLLVPIFDTAFVTLTRFLSGRQISVGGRDHTSHRLIAIGWSERSALVFFYALALASGGIAALSYDMGLSSTVVLLTLTLIGLVLLGVHLSGVHVARSDEPRRGAVLRLLADFTYKRQVLMVALDLVLIVLAYYAAHLLRFETDAALYLTGGYRSIPTVMIAQLAGLAGFGLYQGVWRYIGPRDLLQIVKAVTVGTMATVVILTYVYRFEGFSRTVFVLDGLLLILFIGGTRGSFRLFSTLFRRAPTSFRRVLIYGAGDGGELVLREILNNPALERVPVGFIDDDREKHRRRIHGLPIFGGSDRIEKVLRERGVSEVLVSSTKIQGDGFKRVVEICHELEIPVRRAALRVGERISGDVGSAGAFPREGGIGSIPNRQSEGATGF